MTEEEIYEARREYFNKEAEMWRQMLEEAYPIGSEMEIDGEMMVVKMYDTYRDIPTVIFEKTVPVTKEIMYCTLPKFKKKKF